MLKLKQFFELKNQGNLFVFMMRVEAGLNAPDNIKSLLIQKTYEGFSFLETFLSILNKYKKNTTRIVIQTAITT